MSHNSLRNVAVFIARHNNFFDLKIGTKYTMRNHFSSDVSIATYFSFALFDCININKSALYIVPRIAVFQTCVQ